MMNKKFVLKDEKGNYFRRREWMEKKVTSSTIIDSYFVGDVAAASLLREEEAEEVIKIYSTIFPNLPKLIKVEV